MSTSYAVETSRAKAFLELISEGARGFHPITETGVTIGRHPSNVVRVADERVSRFHCIVRITPAGCRVADLGSRNGTRLNGRTIDSAPLKPGDVVWVGDARLRFVRATADVDWLPDA
jgi:pSer/pThr/pTyr-binding forkhead associated (FHA) protein